MTASDGDILDLGVVVEAEEARTAAVCVNPAGESRLVVAARGWALVVDPQGDRCRQLRWDESLADYPFASMAAADGTFWTAAGSGLIRVDPFAEAVTALRPCEDEAIVGFAFAEGPDGRVWFASYPSCRLWWASPDGAQVGEAERLSDTEEYPYCLAVGDDGWVYAGIGTERRDLVAVLPGQAGPVSLAPPAARGKGSGYVHRGVDGAIYGHWDSAETRPGLDGHEWQRLSGGRAHPVDGPAPSAVRGSGFSRIHEPRPAPWSVRELRLDTRRLTVADAAGQVRPVRLDYRCAGANLSPLTRASDGLVYGTSNHPLHLYTLNPADGAVAEHGPEPVAIAQGNICAWAEQGGELAGAAYAGGHLGLLDLSRPIVAGANPRWVSRHEPVHRPRCILAHPDGEHLVWGGYGGYGDVGGALVITHRPSAGELNAADQVLPHPAIAPHQATTAVGALPGGDVVGATSVEAPGGGHPVAETAVVYVLDWATRAVANRWAPQPGVRTWSELAVADDGLVHLISADGWHLLVDPRAERVLDRHDWTERGPVAFGGVVVDGGAALFVQRHAVTRVDLRTHDAEVAARSDAPLTAGGAVVGRRLYVASGPRMLRVELADPVSAGR